MKRTVIIMETVVGQVEKPCASRLEAEATAAAMRSDGIEVVAIEEQEVTTFAAVE